MIGMIIKYRRVALLGAALLAIGAGWLHGYFSGKAAERVNVLEKTVTVNEKRNEIASNPVDATGLVERLRNGTY